MKKNRFVQVYQKLDGASREDFADFLACRMFNKRKGLLTLLEMLNKVDLEDEATFPSYEEIYKRCFIKGNYDVKTVHSLYAELYKVLLRFLAIQRLSENTIQQSLLALEALRHVKASKAFEAEAKKVHRKLDKQEGLTGDFYLNRYQLANEEDAYFVGFQIRSRHPAFQEKMEALDQFYFGTKFGMCAETASRNRILNANYTAYLEDPLTALYDHQASPHIDIPWINLHRQLLKCLQHPDEDRYYDAFVAQIEAQKHILAREELLYFYKSAQNYCIRRSNLGDTRFQQALFELYHGLLQEKLLEDEAGNIYHSEFKNIVNVALRQKAFDWTESFIQTYQDRVREPFRTNVLAFSKALLYTNKGDTHQAIRLLSSMTFSDVLYDLSARRLLAQIYFEQQDWEALHHHVNALELFLRRQKNLSTRNRNSHLNFVSILRAITKWKELQGISPENEIAKRRQKLADRISNTDPLAYRDWLRGLMLEQGMR